MPGTKVVNGKVVPDPATYPGGRTPSTNAGSQDVGKILRKELDKRDTGASLAGARGARSTGARSSGRGMANAAESRVKRPRSGAGRGAKGVTRRGVAPPMDDKSRPATTGPAMGGSDPRFAGGTNVAARPPIPATPSAQPARAALPSAPGQMPLGMPPGASAGGGAADIARMINAAQTPMPGVQPPGVRRPAVGGPLGQKMMPRV